MGQLYDQLCSFENLYWAFRAARKGKRSLPHVVRFEYGLEQELFQLQDELRSGAYRPGPYRSFYRTDYKRLLCEKRCSETRVCSSDLVAFAAND